MSLFKILFHAAGRMNQKHFWIGIVVFAAYYAAQHWLLKLVGTNLAGFFISLTALCLTIYMLYCLFGKRLHDMGRSVAPLFGMLALMIILAIILQLQYGGMEYFDILMDNPDKHDDAVWMQQQQEIYQEKLASGMGVVRWLLWLPVVLLTLWVGLSKGDPRENRYGLVPEA